MKIYKNNNLTEQIDKLKLGIVSAGYSKQFTFYVYNDSRAHLRNLSFSVEHEEVKIIKNPEEMLPESKETLIIEWSPKVTLKEGLETQLKIKGEELWGYK